MKYHRKRQTQTRRKGRKSYKGGDTTLGSQPFNSFGFENGASSPREAALLHEKNNNAMQHKMNQMSGGKRSSKRSGHRSKRSGHKRSSRSKRSSGKRTRKQRGGSTIDVPSFPPVGGIKQAYSATDLSVGGNTNIVNGLNDAQGDCFATDTCPPTSGGSSHKKKRRQTKRRVTKRRVTKRRLTKLKL
jgi:hypothetical protein